MSLHPLEGQDGARKAVARSLHSGRLPPVLLLHGPRGVGKQRFALWIGQLLLCEAPTAEGPCDACRGCRLSLRIEHPNLLWYLPVTKPPSRGSRARDREALEEARMDLLARIRAEPLRASHAEEPRGLHLATIRNLLHEAGRSPAMGRRRLFLIADAEELVSQESSPEAANALLKVLEEPSPETWFVLTASEPGRLLPTVRSRAMNLHLPPLPLEGVRDFLSRTVTASEEEIDRAAKLSGGSIGRALGFLPDGSEDGPLEVTRRRAFRLLRAALEPHATRRFAEALSFAPSGARGLHEVLTSLETWLRDVAAVAADQDDRVMNHDALEWIRTEVDRKSIHPLNAARAFAPVEEARGQAAGNVNPQLLMSRLLLALHRELLPIPQPERTKTP